MNRPLRVIFVTAAAVSLALAAAACGTQRISIPKSDPNYAQDNVAAHLFAERCAGCHTLSFAATHGSAANPRTAEAINGPNFDQRCERPAIRVLYAIENGGFSGAYMPQNVFVGRQAREVADFVARFAGRDQPKEPGVPTCQSQAIGTLPALPNAAALASTGGAASTGRTKVTPSSSKPHERSRRKRSKPHKQAHRKT
jgi:hypothetical protein